MRAFVALLAGFATMELLIAGVTAAFARRGGAGAGMVAANMVCSFVAAAAGGFVTAWLAATRPLHTVLVLAVVVLVFGAISTVQTRGRRPAWQPVALMVVCALGVMAGGLLRLKATGLL
ncbi:MAG: hypothetical protein ACLGSD_11175 [Acidobacteriota bacterium]